MTKERLAERLGDDDFVVIDSRTDEECNGWTLYGEARGGHISGAIQIPYAWFLKGDKTLLDYDDLQNLFTSYDITSDKEVTSYCTDGIRSGFIYFVLRALGYPRVSNYDGSISEWSADSSLPMDKLARYDRLVYTQWVQQLMAGENPPTYANDSYVIVEASWGQEDEDWTENDYAGGHIPGSYHVNTDEFEGQVHFTTATDTARRISVISGADDHSLAPSSRKVFAGKIALSVLKEIADASAQAGTLLFYNLVPNVDGTTLKLRFETYIDQMGTDRTQELGNKSAFVGCY